MKNQKLNTMFSDGIVEKILSDAAEIEATLNRALGINDTPDTPSLVSMIEKGLIEVKISQLGNPTYSINGVPAIF